MKVTEEQLKNIYKRQTARSTARQAECLTEDQFVRAATGEMGEPERRQVARHLITCADCTEEYRVLRSLESWAEQTAGETNWARGTEPNQPVTSERGRGIKCFWERLFLSPQARLVAVAALVLVVGSVSFITWRMIRQPVSGPIEYERGESSIAMQVDPPNGAHLAEAPQHFSWAAAESAESYTVSLFDFESTLMWQSDPIKRTAVEIPQSVRDKFQRGRVFYWRVFINTDKGRSQSGLFRFSLTPEPR